MMGNPLMKKIGFLVIRSRDTVLVRLSFLTALTVTAPLIAIPASPPVNSSQRIFTGDYSTDDFSQWPKIVTARYNSGRFGFVMPTVDYVPSYPATIIDDPIKGKAARYEIRKGDFVPEFPNVQIAEVTASTPDTGGNEGQTTWYAFSTRFDPTFPQNHADLSWGLTNEWHIEQGQVRGNPPICMAVNIRNGYWSLLMQPQSEPGVRDGPGYSIWDIPLGTDWHDIKLQIHWSATDGWIKLWHNGIRQKLLGDSDTYLTHTLVPGTSSVYYMEGYYRGVMDQTGIVYQQGFRAATNEDAL
jgi:hypothetical protein